MKASVIRASDAQAASENASESAFVEKSGDFRASGPPDDEFVERVETKDGPQDKTTRTTFAPWLRRTALAAACLVLMAFLVMVVPALLNHSSQDGGGDDRGGTGRGDSNSFVASADIADETTAPGSSGGSSQASADGPTQASPDDIFGLPAQDYTWDEGETGATGSRHADTKLADLLFSFANHPETPSAFVVAHITGTDRQGDAQTATATPLLNILGSNPGESFTFQQTLYGGCYNDEMTNLVRTGGVYFLPLTRDDGSDAWDIWGDLDVLFEIDDRNLVHSHSRWEGLSRYDGQEFASLWKDVNYLYLNPLLCTPFADFISRGYTLDTTGSEIVLVAPDGSWDERDRDYFSARIDENGRIAAPISESSYRVFSVFEGMTTSEMNAEIEKIRQFYRR
jgi:hypothetical protein